MNCSQSKNPEKTPEQHQVTNPELTDGTEQGNHSVPLSTHRFQLQNRWIISE